MEVIIALYKEIEKLPMRQLHRESGNRTAYATIPESQVVHKIALIFPDILI